MRFNGTNYYCEDGFHRLEAARRIGLRRIEAQSLPWHAGRNGNQLSEVSQSAEKVSGGEASCASNNSSVKPNLHKRLDAIALSRHRATRIAITPLRSVDIPSKERYCAVAQSNTLTIVPEEWVRLIVAARLPHIDITVKE